MQLIIYLLAFESIILEFLVLGPHYIQYPFILSILYFQRPLFSVYLPNLFYISTSKGYLYICNINTALHNCSSSGSLTSKRSQIETLSTLISIT